MKKPPSLAATRRGPDGSTLFGRGAKLKGRSAVLSVVSVTIVRSGT